MQSESDAGDRLSAKTEARFSHRDTNAKAREDVKVRDERVGKQRYRADDDAGAVSSCLATAP